MKSEQIGTPKYSQPVHVSKYPLSLSFSLLTLRKCFDNLTFSCKSKSSKRLEVCSVMQPVFGKYKGLALKRPFIFHKYKHNFYIYAFYIIYLFFLYFISLHMIENLTFSYLYVNLVCYDRAKYDYL